MSGFPSFNVVLAASGSNSALITFLIYTLAVFALAGLSNRLLKNKSFLSEYFLGSRGLGVWAFALTFAATSSSGGSFTGFPAKIYTHGWILALWIASYMVVPICTMGLIGKRLNHVARLSGAITVPDVIRDRFHSKNFGLLAVALIVFFMSFNLIAQFKAGSLILGTLLTDVEVFHNSAAWLGSATQDIPWLTSSLGPEYTLCLLGFGIAVIIYTTWGGFHAVVWTDVMQGVVMVVGVLIMLPLALSQVGGLEKATRAMAEMTPPKQGSAILSLPTPSSEDVTVRGGEWIVLDDDDSDAQPRVMRIVKSVTVYAESNSTRTSTSKPLDDDGATLEQRGLATVLELTTPADIDRVLARIESDHAQRADVVLSDVVLQEPKYGPKGAYVVGPGPLTVDPSKRAKQDEKKEASGFLPLSLAISFFFMWAISGSGQPANMVRLMAFNNSRTLRRSIFTVAIYYSCIYMPLVVIFCCARILLPGMEGNPDAIMPTMAVELTQNIGAGWLAGLLVAAPFAAVMSTVDSFLLMISSGFVRDIYQRNINPEASEKTVKFLSYLATLVVGTVAMCFAINPPMFLQDIIVYVGSGLAASFLAPVVYALYWPRVNSQGAIGGMLCGFSAHLSMYATGWVVNGSFTPYRLFDFDPIIIGLFASFVGGYLITKATPPPPQHLIQKYFVKGGAAD